MDWVFRFTGPAENSAHVIDSTGAVLVGRRTFDVGRGAGQRPEAQEAFGGAWTGPQFVLTHETPTTEIDANTTSLSGDVQKAVATALEAANGMDVLVLGATVAQQCLDHGLIDEIENPPDVRPSRRRGLTLWKKW
jgi:dihydrofolate reductase